MVSVDSLCKQFRSRSGSRLFATLKVFLKEHFENVNFEKVSNKSMIQLNMCGQLASGVRCLVFLSGPSSIYFCTLCMETVNALGSLQRCEGFS